jgi:transcriptional regulator with XRE-family HTH domain
MRESIEILDFECQEKLDLACLAFLYTRSMDIGQWVKRCRVEANLTQTELGDKLHVSKGNVSAWETNKHEPSYVQMVEIAKAAQFKVPLPGIGMPGWPFKEISPEQYSQLSEADRAKVEERALTLIEGRAVKSAQENQAA